MNKKRRWSIDVNPIGKHREVEDGYIANENYMDNYDKTMEKWKELKAGKLDSRARLESTNESGNYQLIAWLMTWTVEEDEDGYEWESDPKMLEFIVSNVYYHGNKVEE